jgi:D-alanyl-D-alanine carboxypeptidase/D-alanyl-D-alanine-endopeptidase (penicillin-binding protein 4)
MNKFSNNFVADQLIKQVGAKSWAPPGTLQKGITTLQDLLEDLGIKKGTYHIQDGSGLTRDTKVTARQITRVLVAAYHDFSISPEFLSSLGVAGEDGTLKNRFSGSELKSLLRAKTGTIDGVSALAGYFPTKDGEIIAFSILLNDPGMKYGKMSHWIDQITLEISRFTRG